MQTRSRVGFVAPMLLAAAAGTASGQFTGPSSSQSPYVLPSIPGVSTTSILTVGDTVGGYRMVGIPDGLGAFGPGVGGQFTVVMNHELGAAAGVARAHGSTGAFVSRWEINPDLSVASGRDHNTSAGDVNTWNGAGYTAGTTAYARLCSADLAAPSAFQFGGLGTSNRLFLNGEEAGAEGRAFAHVVTGGAVNQSWQLPRMGRFSWENAVASPFAQARTVVVGLDDSSVDGQVYVYVGDKTSSGNDIERAGLTNGGLYGVRVTGAPSETRPTPATGRFDLFSAGNVENTGGAALNTMSVANQVTSWLRPEDGAWDPRAGKQNDFYFVTTDRFNSTSTQGNSRLYRMRFDDVTNPLAGGVVDMLIDGFVDGPNMMDNLCVDSLGRILIQEDIGGQDALGKVWLYDTDSAGLVQIATHDAARFTPGAPGFLTRDEESSGIIDAGDLLGPGWFLLDDQAHYGIGGELVEGGQLLAMYVDPSVTPAPGAAVLLSIGGLLMVRQRR